MEDHHMKPARLTQSLARTAGAAALALAFALAAAPAAQAQNKKVTIALGGDGLHISAIHIPIAKGYFKDEGLDVEIIDVNSGPRQVAAIMGGSALFGPLGLIQVIKANAEGAPMVAAANLFGVLDIHVVLSKEAIAKTGIKPEMSVDEKIRRMKGIRIGITSPGSTTDTTIRTLFKARGMDPDQMVQLQPLGGGTNMLAALEKGATDGFVWSAPQPQIAAQKGLADIVIDPFDRVVPEMIDVPYEVMAINAALAKQNEDVIRKSIRAMTRGMKFTQENPAEALKIMQAHFPNFDQEILRKAWTNYVKGLPKSPVIPRAWFDNTVRWLNITAKSPVNSTYEAVIMNDVAAQAAKDLLGQ
jgi:NitT/TauT family transport system substrate-binding protein